MKRMVCLFIALAFLFAGCQSAAEKEDPVAPPPEATEDGGMTYADTGYFPVVKEPITVTAAIYDNQAVGDYTARSLWKEIAEKTGITFELRLIAPSNVGAESIALFFASRDYPDCAFRLCADTYVHEACMMGDIIELTDEMMELYAPNYWSMYKKYPEIERATRHSDGKLYGLPNLVMEESTYKLRDLHIVNEGWLEELGMSAPETLDQYTDYLRAVKNAAGTGSIPQNAVPLYIRNYVNIGGWYSICDIFGVYHGLNNEIVLNGTTVKSNATDSALRAPIRYLAQLYTEGLINANFTTITWDDYINSTAGAAQFDTPWFVGSYFSYSIPEGMSVLPPLKVSDDITPYARDMGFDTRLIKDAFNIFSGCKYPVALLRAMDAYGTDEAALRAIEGVPGEENKYYINEDGQYRYTTFVRIIEDENLGWNNHGPGLVGEELVEQLVTEMRGNKYDRTYWYYTVYKDYLPTDREQFPTLALAYLSAEENAELTMLSQRCSTVMKSYTTRWIQAKGSVDDEWDGFQKKLEDSGIKRKLELLQKAWDLYSAGSK